MGYEVPLEGVTKAFDSKTIPRTIGSCNHTPEEIAACSWESLEDVPGIGALEDQAIEYGYKIE